MPDGHHENDQVVVWQLTQDAIVPDAIAPEALPVSYKRLAAAARVVEGCNLVFEVIEDGDLPLPVQLGQLALVAVSRNSTFQAKLASHVCQARARFVSF